MSTNDDDDLDTWLDIPCEDLASVSCQVVPWGRIDCGRKVSKKPSLTDIESGDGWYTDDQTTDRTSD